MLMYDIMSKCCICDKIIDLDCETYYWNECFVCNKLLCKDCVDEDKNKMYIGLDIISYGWYIAEDAFENMFCDECFNYKEFKKRNKTHVGKNQKKK